MIVSVFLQPVSATTEVPLELGGLLLNPFQRTKDQVCLFVKQERIFSKAATRSKGDQETKAEEEGII